ncbi:hypothetical protein AB0H18_00585 [Streptomyces sp. NPDC020766]|uniref:hypothetical protein n=1 Tax=Streptomyces sp. NPDC020766 TaxID=3155011 RepID=UPI0033C8B2DE
MSEVALTPVLRLVGMFRSGEVPSTWCPAKERQACEYLAEHLLGTRDGKQFEQLVTALVNK